MKIFNWVHRKLNGQPSSVPLHPLKGEVRMSQLNIQVKSCDEDRETLLGWRDGLLAIGTLGLFTDHHPHDDYIKIPSFNVFDYPKDSFINVDCVDESKLMEEVPLGLDDDEVPLVFNVYGNNEIEEVVDEKKLLISIKPDDDQKGDRTTLADLFKAESVTSQTCVVGKSVSIMKEHNNKKKNDDDDDDDDDEIVKHKKFPVSSLSCKLVKKLIPSHDAQPIKKINHMMKKMMKRKIHPELLLQKSFNEVHGFNGMGLLPQEVGVID